MTLAEFEDKYYLHDSSIDKIDYDADKKILTLTTALPKKFFPQATQSLNCKPILCYNAVNKF